jgi:hypothetical protein
MNPSNLNYQTLKAAEAMKRLQELENVEWPCRLTDHQFEEPGLFLLQARLAGT